MFNKRINPKDLAEAKKRTEQINEYKLVVGALEVQKNIFLRQVLPKYGCDSNKDYNIDFETGRIKEIKKVDKKND